MARLNVVTSRRIDANVILAKTETLVMDVVLVHAVIAQMTALMATASSPVL